jgi:gas vesicle protein
MWDFLTGILVGVIIGMVIGYFICAIIVTRYGKK